MKPLLLLLLLIAFFPSLQEQTVQRETADLTVLKFSWALDKPKTSVIRGAQNPGGSITSSVEGGTDLGSRKAGLRTVNKTAAASSAEATSNSYQLRLELKNTGANVVSSLVWEFKPTAGPEDYQPKRYLCAFTVKPKEKRILEVWTPYAPVKVINVDARADGLKDGELIVNQIEYADGSVWKKPNWNYKLPDGASKKLSDGACSVF